MFEGFTRETIDLPDVTIHLRRGGSGPPLLLLHGYPQTHVMWHRVAPALAERFTVVCPDLRGYGDSSKPPGDAEHHAYSKRTMAADMAALMDALGHPRFRLAGHDRGARVAYRLALDHPERVERLALLDIIPTYTTWERMDWRRAIGTYHWQFLAQPDGLPERLINGDRAWFLRETLRRWAGDPDCFDPEALAEYERCFDEASVHATCEDYRAGASIDYEIDRADFGQKRIGCPLLVLWGGRRGRGSVDEVLSAWREWADDVHVDALDCGHFIAEEAPAATHHALAKFFA
jgi:haloacetate dehalogenase